VVDAKRTAPAGKSCQGDKDVSEKTMPSKLIMPRGIKFRKINLSRKAAHCPRCNKLSKRHSMGRRRLREVGISGPTVLEVTYSKHYCENCRKHFSLPMDHLALPSGRFTNRVRKTAVELVIKQALTLEKATQRMRLKYYVHVPPTTLHDWVVAELTTV
jgi:transposase